MLTCPLSKGWQPRRLRTATSPEHPGTAVRWAGRVYEVLEAVPDAAGGVTYRLAPWEDRHAIRVIESYDAESEAAREAEQRRRRRAVERRRVAILLAPLLGHLPGSVQRRMESELGAPARAMTIASALPLLVLGMLGLLGFLVSSFGGAVALDGWPILPLPIAAYFFAESALRLGIAFLQGEPVGSVAGTLLWGLWRKICDASRGIRRRYAPGPASK